jgi:phosphatidate cytidylyltransferase
MKQRIVVGLVALPVALVPLWLGGLWATGFMLLLALLGGAEFYRMMQIGGYRPAQALGLVWLAAVVAAFAAPRWVDLSLVLMAGIVATLVDATRRHETPVHTWFATSMGALYLGVMIGQAVALRNGTDGLWWLLLALLITWGNDTAAYFVGVTLGRHKLWPRISPNKTWEGTVAGWIAAALVGALWIALTPLAAAHSPWLGLAIGATGGVLALLGDLAMSMFKRQVGVKDSGTLFPGHGGVLDRMDSVLFVLPFVYQAARLAG